MKDKNCDGQKPHQVANGEPLDKTSAHRDSLQDTQIVQSRTREGKSSSKASLARAANRRKSHGWTKRRTPKKYWNARVILQEADSEYLIEYEPVGKGAPREITGLPKQSANRVFVADWEKREQASTEKDKNAESTDLSYPRPEVRKGNNHHNPSRPQDVLT